MKATILLRKRRNIKKLNNKAKIEGKITKVLNRNRTLKVVVYFLGYSLLLMGLTLYAVLLNQNILMDHNLYYGVFALFDLFYGD